MTYEPKFPQCPYMTANRKCVHKHIEHKLTKRKRMCGYGDPNNCEMYCEWLELKKDDEVAPESL